MIARVTVNTMIPYPSERIRTLFATEEKQYLKSIKFKTLVKVMGGLKIKLPVLTLNLN